MAQASNSSISPKAKDNKSSVSPRLTASEVASLRQDSRDSLQWAKGRFAHLKSKAGGGQQSADSQPQADNPMADNPAAGEPLTAQ